MSQISDDIYLGNVFLPVSRDTNSPSSPQNGIGPVGRVYLFDVVPLTLQAAGLAAAQAATGGIVALTAGTGVTTRVDMDGTTRYVLDTPRNVTLTAAGANTATGLVVGYDQYGQRMTESFAAPATSTVAGNKAFKEILSITFSATPGSNVSAGFGDKLGLPVRVVDAGYVIAAKWAGVLAADAGTFVAAVQTDPATASTGDVRGTYTPSSASNGTRRLVMAIGLNGIMVGPNATRTGAAGVTQA
jgi:hypothetical protein